MAQQTHRRRPTALSPLFWTRVNLYGRFELDMNNRLHLGLETASPGPRSAKRETRTADSGQLTRRSHEHESEG